MPLLEVLKFFFILFWSPFCYAQCIYYSYCDTEAQKSLVVAVVDSFLIEQTQLCAGTEEKGIKLSMERVVKTFQNIKCREASQGTVNYGAEWVT